MALRAFLIQIFEMIGRQRAVGGGELRAAEIGKLLGMQLDGQAERLGLVEDAGDLVRREGDAFAEAVDRVDQAFGMRLLAAPGSTTSVM